MTAAFRAPGRPGAWGSGTRAVVAVAVAVVAAIVAVVWWWLAVTPWNEPLVALVVFVPVPVTVWVVLGNHAHRRGLVVAVWLVVVAVVVATVGTAASGAVGRVRLGAALGVMGTVAETSLVGLSVPTEACGGAPLLDYGPIGTPAEVCAVTYDIGIDNAGATAPVPVRQVRYKWPAEPGSDAPGRQLVFEAGVAQPPAGICVRRIDDSWWAWLPNLSGCPLGFVPSSG